MSGERSESGEAGPPQPSVVLARRVGIRHPPSLVFVLRLPPEQVVERLLGDPSVAERDDGAWSAREAGYDLQRVPEGFTLTSDPGGPGAWRPGTQAICEGHLEAIPGGSRLVVRFRLHPLTRNAFTFLALLALAMAGFQLIVAGPTAAALLLIPIAVLTTILAADRNRLRRQREALRSLVESTFTPLAQPQLAAPTDPFRLAEVPAGDHGARPRADADDPPRPGR
ncbi:MAG: hypothetical protein H0T76_03615 [Nannocystis sp.]|nr:hypothetical protein [Nannocystis sp.]MBA3545549.1 hypothetical protein [Nannocystis sp.]